MPSIEHEDLKERARVKLENLGYKVISVPSQMKEIFAKKGYSLWDIGYPDLCAIKGDDVILVQAVKTSLQTYQLDAYQKIGKVILIFNFYRTKNFEVWGWNDAIP
jgi:hypothetical protein